MRNVVLYELISLGGVAEEPGEGEWFVDELGLAIVNPGVRRTYSELRDQLGKGSII
ncbi:hypothetical protein GCM10010399_14270 [Dactylosporangium fulvum]|uniref:Uncharacterized protein n=1 Tax=Dactylosporangium fulvum TaxID=53359 RepID=A0ABY5VT12_9ACTN|nr:hypothetical protein [Dactylosporangium fulvum]UWP80289.1 hypothetical protein Dfulv_34720 [Dactylosporangium fulvum]